MSNKKQAAATPEEPVLFAIDDGSGNMEHCFADKSGEVFEGKSASCVVPKVLADLSGGMSPNAWSTMKDGKPQPYTVTASSSEMVDTCSDDYQLSPANRVLVHNTIAATGIGQHPVYLGVTLPTEQFYIQGSDSLRNDKRIEEKKQNLLTLSENITGVYEMPNIAGVRVYPEAIPAYVYASVLEDGTANPEYPERHTTLVIDLGRYTCDMAVITTGYQVTKFLTKPHGVQKLADKFKLLLVQNATELGLHDISGFSSTDIDDIIDRGYVGSPLETDKAIAARKDVSHLVQEAKLYLNDLIVEEAHRLVGGDFSMLTRIVFVGGGANWLRDLSQEWYHTVDVPTDPEMAIVRGVYMMLQGAKESIKAELGAPVKVDAEPAAAEQVEVEG